MKKITLLKLFFFASVVVAIAGPIFAGATAANCPGSAGCPECSNANPPSYCGGSTYTPPTLPINTNLPITGAVPISGEGGQGPAGLIANFYSFAFLIAGFLAFVMIVYGGVRYTFSGGSHSAKEEAKDAIKQALLGLGLLLVAYLILRTINPDLTTLKLPTLAPYVAPPPPVYVPPAVKTGYGCTSSGGSFTFCSEKDDCSDLKDPATGGPRCAPGTCVKLDSCKPSALTAQCASGPCVTVAGYTYKNGTQVDNKMATVLRCMLTKPGVPAMRITEAMPISSPHQSSCHNNGCCVDMTLASESKTDCVGVEAMLSAARACGATRTLNEYAAEFGSPCKGQNTEKATGAHVHIAGC